VVDQVPGKRDYTVRRDTARGIVIKDGQVLMIDRIRPGMHYLSTPGGGIEPGETPEQACKREIFEESSLDVTVGPELFVWEEGLHKHHFFLCTYISGVPELHHTAEEADGNPDNIHDPRWFTIEELGTYDFGYWKPLKQKILNGLMRGF